MLFSEWWRDQTNENSEDSQHKAKRRDQKQDNYSIKAAKQRYYAYHKLSRHKKSSIKED